MTEATYLGVPMLLLPLFGDQIANIMRVERAGVGRAIHKQYITKEYVYDNLHKILDDEGCACCSSSSNAHLFLKRYAQRARRLSRLMKKKSVSPLKDAIHWVETLAEFQVIAVSTLKH